MAGAVAVKVNPRGEVEVHNVRLKRKEEAELAPNPGFLEKNETVII